MKKSFVLTLGIGIVLSLLAAPLLAADSEEAAKPSWMEPQEQVSSCSAKDPESKGCTAIKDCPFDATISCEGDYSCSVSLNGITCDGVFTPCECAAAPPWCAFPLCYCRCREDGDSDPICRIECCRPDLPPWPPLP